MDTETVTALTENDHGTLLNGPANPAAPMQPAAGIDPVIITTPQRNPYLADDGTLAPEFINHLPDDLKPNAIALQKFNGKTIPDLFRSYIGAEKLIGQRVQPPGPNATPEQVAAWHKLTGVPDDPKEYGLDKAPEKLPEGVEWFPERAAEFAGFAKKIGLTPQQAQELVRYKIEQEAAVARTGSESAAAYLSSQREALQKEFGDSFESKLGLARQFAALTGLPVDHPALIHADVVRALATGASFISDDKFVRADNAGTALPPREQGHRIMTDPQNPWYAAYNGKEGPERQAEASKLVDRLLTQRS